MNYHLAHFYDKMLYFSNQEKIVYILFLTQRLLKFQVIISKKR